MQVVLHQLVCNVTALSITCFIDFSYDLGDGNVTTTSELSVRMKSWTMLNVTRENRIVQVFLNGRRVARAVSPGVKTVSNLHTVMVIGKSINRFSGKR